MFAPIKIFHLINSMKNLSSVFCWLILLISGMFFSCNSRNVKVNTLAKEYHHLIKPSASSSFSSNSEVLASNSETYVGSIEDNEAKAAINNAAEALNVTKETQVRIAAPSMKEKIVVKLINKKIDKLMKANESSNVAKGGLKERMKVGLFSAALGLLLVILGVLFSKVIFIIGLIVLFLGILLIIREMFDK